MRRNHLIAVAFFVVLAGALFLLPVFNKTPVKARIAIVLDDWGV
jgi:hypothetical protein